MQNSISDERVNKAVFVSKQISLQKDVSSLDLLDGFFRWRDRNLSDHERRMARSILDDDAEMKDYWAERRAENLAVAAMQDALNKAISHETPEVLTPRPSVRELVEVAT